MQSREGNWAAQVLRASSSQAHFVLFSIVESGKSYLWKWKTGSQPAESHHSSLPLRGGGFLQVTTAPCTAKGVSKEEEKTTLHKKPRAAPTHPESAHAESQLLTAPATVGTRLAHATGFIARDDHARAAGKPLGPRNATKTGARSELYPPHIFLKPCWILLCSQLRCRCFTPPKHASFQCFKNRSPAANADPVPEQGERS